jgi:chromosome segregation ATPase
MAGSAEKKRAKIAKLKVDVAGTELKLQEMEAHCAGLSKQFALLEVSQEKTQTALGDAELRVRALETALRGARENADEWREAAETAEKQVAELTTEVAQLKEQLVAKDEDVKQQLAAALSPVEAQKLRRRLKEHGEVSERLRREVAEARAAVLTPGPVPGTAISIPLMAAWDAHNRARAAK